MLTPREFSPPSDRPYHSKRPHKKSRSGCKNCKTRKVKCDEARPACRNCVLRKADCLYPDSSSQSDSSAESTHSSLSLSPVVSKARSPTPSFDGGDFNAIMMEPLFSPSSDIDSTDLRLLWFYTTATFSSFSTQAGKEPRVDEILKVKIPQAAFANPFLMNCIFGLSSLHLQALNQDIEPSRVMRYRARAFEGYRKAIEEAKPESYPALIACSLLLTALSSQMFREDDTTNDLYIIDWMIVWKGISLIVDLVSPQKLWESGMAELLFRPPIDLNRAALHIPNNLLFLISSIGIADPEYADVQTYYDTLKYLGSLYSELAHGFGPIMKLRIVTWFTFVPKEFVELSRQKRPRALIILAHYLIFMKVIENLWWVQGIGNSQIRGIVRHLGDAWRSQLTTPIVALGIKGELEVARLLLDDPEWTSPDEEEVVDGQFRDPRVKSLSWAHNSGKRMPSLEHYVSTVMKEKSDPALPATPVSPWMKEFSEQHGDLEELINVRPGLKPLGLGFGLEDVDM